MKNDNGTDRTPTPEANATTDGWVPTPEQPWRPIQSDQLDYLYDYGQPWCNDRYSHPEYQDDGYPAATHHPTECRSYGGAFSGQFEDAWAGLDGSPGVLSVYLARPFRFGHMRLAGDNGDRLALEFEPLDGDGEPFRCSIAASVIRNLAAHLTQTASVVEGWRPPRYVR